MARTTGSGAEERRARLPGLALAALGIVYGDIGTSPLYAFRQALAGLTPTAGHVLGVLSLIFWSLIVVVSLKYLALVMRADNRGEGGILALLALLRPWRGRRTRSKAVLIAVGLFGAALLYGDGMITPAISVLSAVEGLETTASGIAPWVIPITIAILVLLFSFQSRGTARVAALFGPIMVVWFLVIAGLGLAHIVEAPWVLKALDPLYAVDFCAAAGARSLIVLGAVFLVVTGSEALYADMGHFGRAPIRLAWFVGAFPCLLLNYFGQGALVLADPLQAVHPFYHLAPAWGRYPLIGLATVATVIASQAVISGAFSLTRQAVQLGQCPRLTIVQTSSEETGQVYVPAVNVALALATIGLVLGFRTSGNLAAAYGIAVSTTMVITTLLLFRAMSRRWKWRPWLAAVIAGGLLVPDLLFLGANSLKIAQGGWYPILVGGLIFLLMSTWARGRALLRARLVRQKGSLEDFLARLEADPPLRVPGTAVFLTSAEPAVPPILLHHLEHNQVLHEQVLLLTVTTAEEPRVRAEERLSVEALEQGFLRVRVSYGFMQSPNVPVALRLAEELGLEIDLEHTTYYLGREAVIASDKVPGMALWREKLFAFLSRNAVAATAFYNLPPERVVELGIQVEI
ncbi:KUP system potassium uptake protein [Tistlia consotensis]|uniref:Probable potassium transport system protein Kup n=1 Tax=Tistlia consotensis USBA 355 TaxID=560819 RepID=A0A1Y6BDQ8_9PROT|nr:potassium transporter Kup [Tistlia consotensis]SME98249.1 KUP system potassium uptake protein [Tistlia consotensis USBA 355]SNR57562.1 KUP system potassium uptake protein [Tistlia consotensis]